MATVLGLAAQCAPGVAPDTIAAIARAESGLEPLAIHDNTVQRTFQSADLPEAIALATGLIVAQHHSVDLGLMQVNSANLARLGLSITDAFDACRSIEAGGRVLSEAYQGALRGALSAYNTGDPQRGISNGYVSRVEHAALSVPSIVARRFCASSATASVPNRTSCRRLGLVRAKRRHSIRVHRQVKETDPDAWKPRSDSFSRSRRPSRREPSRSHWPRSPSRWSGSFGPSAASA